MSNSETRATHYTIQDNGYRYRTGRAGDRQLLAGILHGRIVGVWFDARGCFERVEVIDPSVPIHAGSRTKREYEEEALLACLREELEGWLEQVGFQPRSIVVNSFFVNGLPVGIIDMPNHYKRFLANPAWIEDTEEREEWKRDIQEWMERHNYILRWGDDLWMNGEGQVIAT
jgi:hypothetical protein